MLKSDNLISRAAAIDALCEDLCGGRHGCKFYPECENLKPIRHLPSAQPERKRGKWEIYVISMFDGEGCRCSECGLEGVPYWDFCPNCGADMRGESDDIPNEYFESGGK